MVTFRGYLSLEDPCIIKVSQNETEVRDGQTSVEGDRLPVPTQTVREAASLAILGLLNLLHEVLTPTFGGRKLTETQQITPSTRE